MKGLRHPSRTPQASRRAQGKHALLRSLVFFFFIIILYFLVFNVYHHPLISHSCQ